jgi:hypothetical protein
VTPLALAQLSTDAVNNAPLRLLGEQSHEREPLAQYPGYRADRTRGRDPIDLVEAAGLRGRGGAAFPAGVKLRSVADRPSPRYVVANRRALHSTSRRSA